MEVVEHLDGLIHRRLDWVAGRRDRPPLDKGGVPILLQIACLCDSLRGDFVEPDRLTFLLGEQIRRDYVASRSLLLGEFRSLLSGLAFVVNGILHAEIPEYPVEGYAHLGPHDSPKRTGSLEEQKRQVAHFAAAVFSAADQRDADIAARGLPDVNPYGFSQVIPYEADGGAALLHIETSNVLSKPFYLLIKRLPANDGSDFTHAQRDPPSTHGDD